MSLEMRWRDPSVQSACMLCGEVMYVHRHEDRVCKPCRGEILN